MDGSGETSLTEDDGTPDHVPHVAFSTRRGPVPKKAFVSKPFSSRSLMGLPSLSNIKTSGTLLERLHGKGPIVKWPRNAAAMRPMISLAAEIALPPPSSHLSTQISAHSIVPQTDSSPTVAMPVATQRPVTPPIVKPIARGENMSERFIAERLLSDRGGSNFNPQIPRRVPDIPSPASIKASEADSEGRRLVIGRIVQISGEITGCERLVVEGKADVTLRDVKMLEVGSAGSFKGTATVETAIIIGAFEGTLKVSGHLEIGAGAVVKGTVSYGTISIANGGKLLGTVEAAS